MHRIRMLFWLSAALLLFWGASLAHAQPGKPSTHARASAQLAEEDRDLMQDLAYANLGEIALGRMAVDKTMSLAVRSYAQKIIDSHTRAQNELEKLAKSHGLSLPGETDMRHKTIGLGLRGLAGGVFDAQYIRRVGINENERFIDLLQQASEEAQDARLRSYASRMLRMVGQHLSMANDLEDEAEGME
jgi:putative membrane protein